MRGELRSRSVKPAAEAARAIPNGHAETYAEDTIQHIQDLMWKDAGIVRAGSGLRSAIQRLEDMRSRTMKPQTRRGHEAQNLATTGMLVARSALAREESRGAHYRTDFPDHNDAKFLKHSIIKGDSIRFA
jgi:L-aspartate oxidase